MQSRGVRRELSAFAGYVDADGEVAKLRNFQIYRVTCHLRALSNGHSWLAIEHEGAVGARGDRRLFASKRNVRGADLQRDIAERVRKRRARAPPAQACVHDHADGLIVEHSRSRILLQ